MFYVSFWEVVYSFQVSCWLVFCYIYCGIFVPSLHSVWCWYLRSVLLLFDPIHPSPVLVVPDHLAPATVASGGDIYTTIWSVAVILVVASLCLGLTAHVNIGVGGGGSTVRDRGTVSNAIS